MAAYVACRSFYVDSGPCILIFVFSRKRRWLLFTMTVSAWNSISGNFKLHFQEYVALRRFNLDSRSCICSFNPPFTELSRKNDSQPSVSIPVQILPVNVLAVNSCGYESRLSACHGISSRGYVVCLFSTVLAPPEKLLRFRYERSCQYRLTYDLIIKSVGLLTWKTLFERSERAKEVVSLVNL